MHALIEHNRLAIAELCHRHRVHGYAAVDHRTVWRTIEEDLENLRNRLRVLLSEREDIP